MEKSTKNKIILLVAVVALFVLSAALIPANLFLFNFPEWLVVLIPVFALLLLLAYFGLHKTKLVTKIVLPTIFTLLTIILAIVPYCIPYWNSYSLKGYRGGSLNYDTIISYSAAKHDLDEAMGYLQKTHPMFMGGLTEEIEERYALSIDRLKEKKQITVNDLRREIQYIINPMHDAHTTTYNNFPADKYLSVAPLLSSQGYSIKSVNGMDVSQLIENAKPYYSYETEEWISIDLGSLASLDFYGITLPATYIWQDDKGNNVEVECAKKDFVPYDEYMEIRNKYFDDADGSEKSFVYYEVDEGKSLATLTLTSCVYNSEYIACVEKMFTEVKAKGIKTVAVDLRGNGGGSSMVANEFIKYLPVDKYNDMGCDWRLGFISLHFNGKMKNQPNSDLQFDGKVYILTDSHSFSAAKDFAMLIQDNSLGEVIGESPANLVNGYGDVSLFYLPNTGMPFQISTKKWYRADPDNDSDYVIPDHPCDGDDVLEELYKLLG